MTSPRAFPLDALPGPVREIVEGVAESTQTPPDLAAAVALATIATTSQGRFEVLVRPGWAEPLSVYLAVALPPGERKSAVMRGPIVRPLYAWASEENTRRSGQIRDGERRIARLEALRKKAERTVLDCEVGTPEYAEAEAAADGVSEELHAARAAQVVPFRPTTSDATPEAMARLMAAQDGRLAILSAEGAEVFALTGRYGNGPPNLDLLLKAHAGDRVEIDRANPDAPPVVIEAPALTICAALQPDALHDLMRSREMRGRGLLARFLYSRPPSRVGHRSVTPGELSEMTAKRWAEVVVFLLSQTAPPDGRSSITLDHGGTRALLGWSRWIERELGADGCLAGVRDWGGKLAGATVRLAGLLHLAECAEIGATPTTKSITENTVDRAVMLAKFYRDEALRLFAEGERTLEEHREDAVMRAVLRHFGEEVFKIRDLHQIVKSTAGITRTHETAAVCAELADRQLLVEMTPTDKAKTVRAGSREYATRCGVADELGDLGNVGRGVSE